MGETNKDKEFLGAVYVAAAIAIACAFIAWEFEHRWYATFGGTILLWIGLSAVFLRNILDTPKPRGDAGATSQGHTSSVSPESNG